MYKSLGSVFALISDGFLGTGSIGAVAVSESDSNVVYAGTGSACPRGNVSPGVGVYKSTDSARLGFTCGYVHRLNGKPTEGAHRRFDDLKSQLAGKLANLQSILDGELAEFRTLVCDKGVGPIVVK